MLRRLFDLPYLLLAFAPLTWAGNLVVGRAVRGEIGPFALNWWRWTLGAALLVAVVRGDLWRQRRLLARHWKLMLLLALSGIALFHSAVYVGLTQTTAVNAALIIALGPVLIVPLAWAILGERAGRRQLLGVAISSLGVVLVILRGDPRVLGDLAFNRGDLWLLFGSFCWGLYCVLLKLKPAALDGMVMLVASILIGALLTTPLYLWELADGGGVAVTPQTLLAVGYLGIFAAALAYIAWNRGVQLIGPSRAGLFLHLIPVYSALLAVFLLDERLQGYHLAGFALILAGLAVSSRGGARPAAGA